MSYINERERLDALEAIASANRQMAERAKAPGWYHPTLGVLAGGLLAVQELPTGWVFGYEALAVVAMGLLVAAYRRHTGLWIPGYRAGRTRWVAVGGAVTFVAVFLACVWVSRTTGVHGICALGGAVIAGLVTIKGRLWEKAYRRDLGVEA
ncbi:hypothetical protein [Phenylobacterium sp.]|uniref:hypothetical protein n=1 Tax=Phenylobacterium sp. TaxID=1871053 RepID=UPI003565EC6F